MLLSLYKHYLSKFKGEQAKKAQNDESTYQNLVTREDLHGTVISKLGTSLLCGVT